MDPFAAPPSTPPVSFEPPADPPAPRRGRMALVALASAGLLAAGVVGVSALASADDPALDGADAANLPARADDGAPDDPVPTTASPSDVELDGEIRIDTGDGDPTVIDLGDLGDTEAWEQFRECADLPIWLDDSGEISGELDLTLGDGELGDEFGDLFQQFESMFEEFFDDGEFESWLDDLPDDLGGPITGGPGVLADGGSVTVIGPDGVSIIDLGDGDGSVTITRDGDTGELTITTDGTAIEQQLDDLLADLPWFDGDFAFPEFDGEFELPQFDDGELPGFPEFDGELPGGLDLDRITDCLADLG